MSNGFIGDSNRTSFYKLLSEHDLRIVIPMIQREYAQGRKNAREVRSEFLKALCSYLEAGIANRDLDFIYGNITDNDFIPLDGQQRLTTLFLLHWYLSHITEDEGLKQKLNKALLDSENRHCRFSYRTRLSSQDFCDALMVNPIELKNVKSVKETIEDLNWFHLSWKNDPTIVGMLNMLEDIHTIFSKHSEYLEKLLDTKNPIITFLFMEMDKYHLSDELYIKMNSRGKQLTDFENFKARYIDHIKSQHIDEQRIAMLDNQQVSMNLDSYISRQIDIQWTNMIWAYRDKGNTDKDPGQECDRHMSNLIMALLLNNYLEQNPQSKGDSDHTVVALKDDSDISFINLRDGNALTPEATKYLSDSMDILASNNGKASSILDSKFNKYFPLDQIISDILEKRVTYNQRVLLYAYLGFILLYKTDNPGINQWLRVVSNFTNPDNFRIDNVSELSNAIQSINKLFEHAPNILQYLADDKPIDTFHSWLIEEERIKARLILNDKNSKWLDKIIETENHEYFNGQIGFILEFAGLWNTPIKDTQSHFDIFVKYSNDAQAAFKGGYEKRVNDIDKCFERAVLSKGDYLPSNNRHYNLLSSDVVGSNIKRDFSWKRHLRVDFSNDIAIKRRGFVKAVFDDPNYDFNNPIKSMKRIIKERVTGDQWRNTLINYPDIFKTSQKGFISFNTDVEGCGGIFPMNSSKLSGYHCELYTYTLFLELKKEKFDISPFKEWKYAWVKGNDELPAIHFNGFTLDYKKFRMAIVAETNIDDWSLKCFRIEFIRNGKEKHSPLIEALKEVLVAEDFRKKDDDIFVKRIKSIKKAADFVRALPPKLRPK